MSFFKIYIKFSRNEEVTNSRNKQFQEKKKLLMVGPSIFFSACVPAALASTTELEMRPHVSDLKVYPVTILKALDFTSIGMVPCWKFYGVYLAWKVFWAEWLDMKSNFFYEAFCYFRKRHLLFQSVFQFELLKNSTNVYKIPTGKI